MEDGISMAAKRQVTLRFRDEYMRASKKQKGVILDRMCESLGIGRSTARRLLAQAGRRTHNEAVPAERPRRYSDRSRELLREVWVMMDMPCGKYLKTMLPQWLPMLRACGELDVRRVHVRRAHDDERGHGRPVPQTRARRVYFVKLRWTCSALNLDTVGVQLEHRRRLVPCFVVCLVYFMRECLFR